MQFPEIEWFTDNLFDRMIECGIAEQNGACVAAALAAEGFTPVLNNFLFASMSRAYNQIRQSILVEATSNRGLLRWRFCNHRSVQQGSLGSAGDVEVIDVPAQTAISIGLRGNVTDERLDAAKRGLEGWLQDHGAEYEAVGPVRVMGYISPFEAAAKKYTEVQIPVRTKQ